MEARSMEHKTNFHEHLIWEILLKLPVKSLIRFKCVSKSWLSLLSDDEFAKLHFDLTASHTQQLLFSMSVSFVDSSKAQIRYIDPEAAEELESHSLNLVSPFPSPPEAYHVTILGACRGFILLGHSPILKPWWKDSGPPKNLLVWNPSTGIHTTLSYSEFGSKLRCIPYQSICVRYSFEYDAFTDDYFVVIVWHWYILVDKLEVFSMRTNSWKQFHAPHFPYIFLEWVKPSFSFVNRAIHWLSMYNYVNGELVKAIIAFDLTEGKCSEIPLPHDGFVDDCILRLDVIRGCLCLLYGARHQGFAELWIMKEYKVKSSWTKCSYVSPHATPLSGSIFCPIYFTKDGQIVGSNGTFVAKLSDKGELLHSRKDYIKKYHIYTESLLSLPTDSGQA